MLVLLEKLKIVILIQVMMLFVLKIHLQEHVKKYMFMIVRLVVVGMLLNLEQNQWVI